MDEARDQLLPLVEGEDLSHPALRALLVALKAEPARPPETLMAELAGDQERGLLALLLMEERSWPDPGTLITEYSKRMELRHRLKRIHLLTQAIVQAQASGDPGVAQLEVELRELQRQAQEVRGLTRSARAR